MRLRGGLSMHWRLVRRMLRRLMRRVLRRVARDLMHRFSGRSARRWRRGLDPAKLEVEQPVHSFEFGFEIFEPLIVLSVGTDCNVGKMTAQLQLVKGLNERGLRTRFVATGQTGIFIEGWGIAVDAVVAEARPGDLVLTLGAGDVWRPGEEILARLGTAASVPGSRR